MKINLNLFESLSLAHTWKKSCADDVVHSKNCIFITVILIIIFESLLVIKLICLRIFFEKFYLEEYSNRPILNLTSDNPFVRNISDKRILLEKINLLEWSFSNLSGKTFCLWQYMSEDIPIKKIVSSQNTIVL